MRNLISIAEPRTHAVEREQSMTQDVLGMVLDSLLSKRLVIFFGAGMSMGEPSAVPSAFALAAQCAGTYGSKFGSQLPAPLDSDLAKLTLHFLERNQLYGIFTEQLVYWPPFWSPCNEAHTAVADFLACKAIPGAATTNIDGLTEQAAASLGEANFRSSLDGNELNVAREHAAYLKIHGCGHRDWHNILWCKEQLGDARYTTLTERLASSKRSLPGLLANRDVVFLGFWTDWSYLNGILADVISTTNPPSVTVIDLSDSATLKSKAPDLYSWATSGKFPFHHLAMDCVDFMQELRMRFSRVFVRRAFQMAVPDLKASADISYSGSLDAPPDASSDDLYQLRKDISGDPSGRPARSADPEDMMISTAAVHLRARHIGLTASKGGYLDSEGRYLRIVNGRSRTLSVARNAIGGGASFSLPTDLIVAANVVDDATTINVVRTGETRGFIARDNGARWLTLPEAEGEGLL